LSLSPPLPSWQGHKSYELSLAWLDRGVGTVLWALQRRGVAQSTLTIFTSDHAALDKGHCYTQVHAHVHVCTHMVRGRISKPPPFSLASDPSLSPWLLDPSTGPSYCFALPLAVPHTGTTWPALTLALTLAP
jgi:arylsulfatase A-like enzyme